MRMYIIYAPETDCSLRVLACPSHETAVADDELAVYAVNSLENFVRIQLSRHRLQLSCLWLQLSCDWDKLIRGGSSLSLAHI